MLPVYQCYISAGAHRIHKMKAKDVFCFFSLSKFYAKFYIYLKSVLLDYYIYSYLKYFFFLILFIWKAK